MKIFSKQPNPILIFNRLTKSIDHEKVYARSSIDFIYGTYVGRLVRHLILKESF